jgi:hypothetical protein
LAIYASGTYENYDVDGRWRDHDLVRIKTDNVTLRRCDIHGGIRDGIEVYGQNVVIDSCRIFHLLAGSYARQIDAHGITGSPRKLVIRNCEIFQFSGDGIQFDPDHRAWDDVLVENCTIWTGPLAEDMAGFKKGQRPGENAVDTKQIAANPRSHITLRNCAFYGFRDGQIINMAALNLKQNVEVTVENCLLRDNEICFRLRGGTGKNGGALVTLTNVAVYDSQIALRVEDKLKDLKITRMGIGKGIGRKLQPAGGGLGTGYQNTGEFPPPAYDVLLKNGFSTK